MLQIQIALSSMSAALQAAKARLDGVEEMRIPVLEERLQEVSRNSAEVGFAKAVQLPSCCMHSITCKVLAWLLPMLPCDAVTMQCHSS